MLTALELDDEPVGYGLLDGQLSPVVVGFAGLEVSTWLVAGVLEWGMVMQVVEPLSRVMV